MVQEEIAWRTDGGHCNIPITFLKKCGDNNIRPTSEDAYLLISLTKVSYCQQYITLLSVHSEKAYLK